MPPPPETESGEDGSRARPRTVRSVEGGRADLEIGFQLIPLVDEKQGGQMLSRVRRLRRHLANGAGLHDPAGAHRRQSAA